MRLFNAGHSEATQGFCAEIIKQTGKNEMCICTKGRDFRNRHPSYRRPGFGSAA